jgi:putative zinc finger/helix-turn-helix YgiT family protein
MNRIVFCPECRQDVRFSVREQLGSAELKGAVYEFMAKTAHCDECGMEVYVPEIEDENLKALYDAYRQKHGIISLEDIREIPEKYNIGKRPLSLLLGWGEQTFSRYYEGDMPAKQYSEKLTQILSDPAYYLSLLETGKGNLSKVAYEKSKVATERLLSIPPITQKKLEIVVEYLLFECQDITHLALQKALYYVQGFHKAFFGSFIFEEDCEAWVHGPVYRDIYRRFSGYCYDPIGSVEQPDTSAMSAEEKVLLDSIVKHICCYSGKTLESFTHGEMPWISTRGNLPANASTNKVIPKQMIGEYFTLVKDKYSMLTPANIKDYAQDMFSKI